MPRTLSLLFTEASFCERNFAKCFKTLTSCHHKSSRGEMLCVHFTDEEN